MARHKDTDKYFGMGLEELERAKREVDEELGKLREEKAVISSAMDRVIHRTNAEARLNEMSQEERVALREVLGG